MTNVTICGTITETTAPTMMTSGQTVQRIRLKVTGPHNKLGNLNTVIYYYDCFLYGKKEIAETWSHYRDDLPAPPVTVTAVLTGKISVSPSGKQFNNLSLRIKTIKFHYDDNK